MPHRNVTIVATALCAMALAACGSSAAPTTPTAPAPSVADLDATAAWADGVCTSLTEVRTAIRGIGDDLEINPLEGAGAVDAARAQIAQQVDEVSSSLDGLRSAVAGAPDTAGARKAQAAIQASLDDLQTAQREAADQAAAAASADSPADFIAAAGGALVAVRAATAAVGDVYAAATGAASDSSAAVRAAFDEAPACEAFRS